MSGKHLGVNLKGKITGIAGREEACGGFTTKRRFSFVDDSVPQQRDSKNQMTGFRKGSTQSILEISPYGHRIRTFDPTLGSACVTGDEQHELTRQLDYLNKDLYPFSYPFLFRGLSIFFLEVTPKLQNVEQEQRLWRTVMKSSAVLHGKLSRLQKNSSRSLRLSLFLGTHRLCFRLFVLPEGRKRQGGPDELRVAFSDAHVKEKIAEIPKVAQKIRKFAMPYRVHIPVFEKMRRFPFPVLSTAWIGLAAFAEKESRDGSVLLPSSWASSFCRFV
ncbi:hypothetical protein H6P81_015113 [Aristolochia fimbriata]|uniref:Uncharacterized protein n=1 Tax=Aristolochia fimbriata TaxID=158543 RepID=A0AAV7E582_ARIFI|nr:hypothetical protein H6P81_015113 [Aristolochia fimbriata]